MKKSKDNKNEENKNFSTTQKEQLKELFDTVFNSENSNINSSEAKDLESIKIILASILNNQHLESLTNLNEEQIDDINDALYLSIYFDNPLIIHFIEHRLKLSRSVMRKEPKNLLTILSEIAGKTGIVNEFDNKSTILGRLRGN